MKQYLNVKSTAEKVPNLEVNIDTVYIRTDIEGIETEEFTGWQYDEVQYNKNEYIEKLTNDDDAGRLALMVSMLMSEVDMLKNIIVGGNQYE